MAVQELSSIKKTARDSQTGELTRCPIASRVVKMRRKEVTYSFEGEGRKVVAGVFLEPGRVKTAEEVVRH